MRSVREVINAKKYWMLTPASRSPWNQITLGSSLFSNVMNSFSKWSLLVWLWNVEALWELIFLRISHHSSMWHWQNFSTRGSSFLSLRFPEWAADSFRYNLTPYRSILSLYGFILLRLECNQRRAILLTSALNTCLLYYYLMSLLCFCSFWGTCWGTILWGVAARY